MRASVSDVEIIMANQCLTIVDVCKNAKIPKTTLNNVLAGRSVRPATLGKVARALNVDVREIMEVKN